MLINDKHHHHQHQHYAQHRNQFLNSMNNPNSSGNDRFSSSFSPTSIYVYKPLIEDVFVEQQVDEKTIQFNLR